MPTLLHFGTGNFHRAHQAVYTQDAGGWTITGVSLRSRAVIDALSPRNCTYTLATQSASGTRYRQIDVISEVLFAPDNPEAVIEAVAKADMISLTITEKGYCLGANGTLDLNHPQIVSDLDGTSQTAIALLAHGLSRRSTPVAVLSCDNLTGNGDTLSAAVNTFAARAAIRLPAGITFPNCMVDRITPATTGALRAEVLAQTGLSDHAPVATEPFTEWVIEKFDAPHPDWDKAGAQFVTDVAPYEARKLRMLNGAHSTLAYAGLLAGYEFVHEAIADPKLLALIDAVMDEAAQTLPSQIETASYKAALLERFANPNLHHKLRQIAMDGSQKLPVRLVEAMAERTARGAASPALSAGIEAWCDFVVRETENHHKLDDPMADTLALEASKPDAKHRLKARIGAP